MQTAPLVTGCSPPTAPTAPSDWQNGFSTPGTAGSELSLVPGKAIKLTRHLWWCFLPWKIQPLFQVSFSELCPISLILYHHNHIYNNNKNNISKYLALARNFIYFISDNLVITTWVSCYCPHFKMEVAEFPAFLYLFLCQPYAHG